MGTLSIIILCIACFLAGVITTIITWDKIREKIKEMLL